MSNLTPIPSLDDVYQLEKTDKVEAGAGGIANAQAQALLNRTQWITQQLGNYATQAYADSAVSGLSTKLADPALPANGGGAVAFGYSLNYAAATMGWAVQQTGYRLEWFYLPADGNDYLPAFNRAMTALGLLTGPAYGDSMGQAPYGYGVSRGLNLAGKKYPISNTLTLASNIGIFGNGGGFYALPAFPAAAFMIDTGTAPYEGRVENLTLDGSDLNVKGVRITNGYATRWSGLSIVSVRNDAIDYVSGAEFILDRFMIATSGSPVAPTVAGIRVRTSDAHFINGIIKFAPVSMKFESGSGNNEINTVHVWGLYNAFKMYIGFHCENSIRNIFTNCFADSPTKQDYAQDNLATVNGMPNGGVGFYFDSASSQNTVAACRGFINLTSYTGAGLPNAPHLWLVYRGAIYTAVTNCTYNYTTQWAGGVRDGLPGNVNNGALMNTPDVPNGISAPRLSQSADNGAGSTVFTIQNSVAAPAATSNVNINLVVGTTTVAALGGTQGSGGVPFLNMAVMGTETFRATSARTFIKASNVNETDIAFTVQDGVGANPGITVYRQNGATAANAAAAAIKTGHNSVTNRSINSPGTINASGADMAEYVRKAEDCGAVAKGQIVGLDSDGRITDKWSAIASRCMVKTTSPHVVGGDDWAAPAGPEPVEPEWVAPAEDVGPTGLVAAEQEHERRMDAYRAARAAHEEEVEKLRQGVDRLAFCGRVPVNVLGADVGDFIVPRQDGDRIFGEAVRKDKLTLADLVASVGQVVSIEPDGRALIIVKT